MSRASGAALNHGFTRDEEREDKGAVSTLHQLFSQQAFKYPQHFAVEFQDVKLTYKQLDQKSNQFARTLQRKFNLNSKDERVVAILLPRCPELYLTMLAAMKAGAAYTCIDPQHQRSRLEFVLQDTNAVALVTTKQMESELRLGELNLGSTKILDIKSKSLNKEIASHSLSDVENSVPGSNLCYIIYTSGSTGTPKGVEIEHRTVLNFIKGELEIFPVGSEERVLQGFSPSFDASVEEIWLAFSKGSTLVAAPPEVMQSGPDLPLHLNRLNITVFSTVPTLLRTIPDSSASLYKIKLLILGGEACGDDLVAWGEGRMLVNSYGPTETTVVATTSVIKPNKKITIGRPLKNYHAHVLNSNLEDVKQGEEGELCIGGQCLARGYRNLQEKTRQQFIDHPFHGKIYRTGDLVRITHDDEIEYLGRIDDQVKIRGFRVEIGSIETHLQRQVNVKMAAVVVVSPAPGQQIVVAHMTLEDAQKGFRAQQAAANMKKALPDYMVPNGFVLHEDLPTLPSGKIDKKKLKASDAKPQSFNASEKYTAPRDDIEKTICEIWESKLCNPRISIEDNFFELGGQSVVAAMVISGLRKKGLELSVRDLYVNPTVATLAEHYKKSTVSKNEDHVTVHIPDTPTRGKPRYYLCWFLQTLWLFGWSGAASVLAFYLLILFLDVYSLVEEAAGFYGIVGLVTGLIVVAIPLYVTSTILWAYVVKKLLIGKEKPGAYALWSMYYLRWWMAKGAKAMVPTGLISGTPFINMYARLMGAKIGSGVYNASSIPYDFGLIEIGSEVCIEPDVLLATHRIDKGTLFLGRIIIGDGCSIGTRSTIAFGSVVKRNSTVQPLTLVPDNTVIEEGSRVKGSPARAVPPNAAVHEPQRAHSTITLVPDNTMIGPQGAHSTMTLVPDNTMTEERSFLKTLLANLTGSCGYPVGEPQWKWAWWVPCVQMVLLCLFNVIFVLPYLSVMIVVLIVPDLNNAFVNKDWTRVAMVIPPAAIYIQAMGLLLGALSKWCIVGKLREGNYSINSSVFIRLWAMNYILRNTLVTSKELFATLYTNIWLKTLGMKLGKYAEVSTAFNFVPDLVELKDRAFIADHVSLGGATFATGRFTLRKTSVGRRTFLGNNCVNLPQSTIESDVLIGVLSSTPEVAPKKSSWLGSPPFALPARAVSNQSHSSARTFSPPLYLYIGRLIWEAFKIILPPVMRFYSLYAFWVLVDEISYEYLQEGTAMFWVSAAFWEWSIVFCNLLLVMASKWILIGRFRPSEHPLWSGFVWRAELVASLEENVAVPLGLGTTLGTPWICWWYRALGAKIGRRVYLASIYLTEADLIEIGDEACIGGGTTIQSHLFEDRVMKMDKLFIGDECSILSDSVVLYGARVENRCTLMPLSLCMKSETLESDAVYCGIPAQKVVAELHHGYHIDWELTRKMRQKTVPSAANKNVTVKYWRPLEQL